MTKKRRYLLLIGLVAAVSLLLCGCSADAVKEEVLYEETFSGDSAQYGAALEAGDVETAYEGTTATVQEGRKLIKRVDLTIETQSFDEYLTMLDNAVAGCGGYTQSSDVYGTASRMAQYTVRIPVEALEQFLADISQKGVIAAKSTSQVDVTLSYVDKEAHITALRAEESSLLRLLEEAGSLDDIVSLQNRLSDVRYEIESYESQLRTLDNQIDYATVSFSIEEVKREEPVVANPTTWAQIDDNWSSGFRSLWSLLKSLFVLFASVLPFAAIILVIILPVVLFAVILPRRRQKKACQEEKDHT